MKKFIISLAIGLMIALPAASQAATCPAGQHWNATKGICEAVSGGAPLFRLPRVYSNWDYFNSPAPVYGGYTLWVATNQWSLGTLHVFNGSQEFTLQTTEKAFTKYFNLNHIPDGQWHAKLCTDSYMGEICGGSMVFTK